MRFAQLAYIVLFLFVLVGLVACGDEEDDSTPPQETVSPAVSGGPTQPVNHDAMAAARSYLDEEGIDGDDGDLSDPVDCALIPGDNRGKFCVHQAASIFAPGLVILIVGDADEPNNRAWEMRLAPTDSGWEVTSVEPYGTTE